MFNYFNKKYMRGGLELLDIDESVSNSLGSHYTIEQKRNINTMLDTFDSIHTFSGLQDYLQKVSSQDTKIIQTLQTYLVDKSIYIGGGAKYGIDGLYGPKTMRALIFSRVFKKMDGISFDDPSIIKDKLLSYGATKNDIKNIQRLLQDSDLSVGPIDGLWGPKTNSAFSLLCNKISGNEAITTDVTNELHTIDVHELVDKQFEQQYPSIKHELASVGSPITTREVVLAGYTYHIPVSWLMAIMKNDSQFGTVGIGKRYKNPGNVGMTNSGGRRGFATRQKGVNACAKHIHERIVAFQQRYPHIRPTLKQLITNSGPDGKGFLKYVRDGKEFGYRVGISNPQKKYAGTSKEYIGVYMTDRSAWDRVPSIANTYENHGIPGYIS